MREFVGPEPWVTRAVVCGCRAEELARARWQRALAASDITEPMRAMSFAGYDARHDAAALAATRAWAEAVVMDDAGRWSQHLTTPPWLLLYGATGNGKTHLLAAAFNAMLAGGRYPLYTLVPALLDHIRDGLDESAAGGEYSARFRAVREAPVLILDDLGAEGRTRWTEEMLFKLLDHRYRQQLPTAVASNLLPDDLEPRIGSRLQDEALAAVVMMQGPDYRRSARSVRSVRSVRGEWPAARGDAR